jgi:hypothetical protein
MAADSLYLTLSRDASSGGVGRTDITKERPETVDNDMEPGLLQSLADLHRTEASQMGASARDGRTDRTGAPETIDNDREIFWFGV